LYSPCPAASSDISPEFYSRLKLEADSKAYVVCANDPEIKKLADTWFITENIDE